MSAVSPTDETGASASPGPAPATAADRSEHTPPPAPTSRSTSPTLRIQETFISLQGEGGLVGVPSSFVRVSGCNLRCAWCDSPRSSWSPEGDSHSIDELLAWCERGPSHVVLTGGEPLLYPATVQLAAGLRELGKHVTIETAGTRVLEGLACDLMSISPKLRHATPQANSGISPRLLQQHIDQRFSAPMLRELLRRYPWQLKFVVRGLSTQDCAEDIAEILEMLAVLGVADADRARVFLMPEGTDASTILQSSRALVRICIEHGFRLGLRHHIDLFGHTPGT